MEMYQCYVIDRTHHIGWATEIECEGESTARARADGILAQHPACGVELWRNERLCIGLTGRGAPPNSPIDLLRWV